MSGKLVLLSGPSCVGKTPLLNSLRLFYPQVLWGRPVLYTSREPRPNEEDGKDYHFRSEQEIQALPQSRYVTAKTRNVWQAIDLDELDVLTQKYKWIIYDAHLSLAGRLLQHERIRQEAVEIVRVFLQPVSMEEIAQISLETGTSAQETVQRIMATKLVVRAQNLQLPLNENVMIDIQIRSSRAWEEILQGQSSDLIFINHDGEDSPNWLCSPPAGDAGKTLQAFAEIFSCS
ncbi:MAG: hypothetical protein EHM72_02465 [Calditrichaeota bacterium]|nr:MAG: hypothetical protein EHM72_02465 [Calditrichota bacterium]